MWSYGIDYNINDLSSVIQQLRAETLLCCVDAKHIPNDGPRSAKDARATGTSSRTNFAATD